ncbi:MAG TPA: hypothetical protein VIZ00_00495, partial [Streptosporangiaceae bacterium]
TAGFSRAFLVAAGIGLLGLVIAIATIRVRRQDLAGAAPAPQEAAPPPAAPPPATLPPATLPPATLPPATLPQPAAVQQNEDRAALAAAARPCRLC